MVKLWMSPLDVKATVEEISARATGLRLLNVYDVTPKTFLFKFGHGDTKVLLMVESGVRMHVTTLDRAKPKVPSQFTLKLRKHIRSWRLDAIQQIQHDRTVDLRFGVDSASFHILIELFGKGNVILTDHEYRALMVLRRDHDVVCRVKDIVAMPQAPAPGGGVFSCATLQHSDPGTASAALLACLMGDFSKAQPTDSLKTVVCNATLLGPVLAEHALLGSGVKPSVRKGEMTVDQVATMGTWLVPAVLATLQLLLAPGQPGGFLIKKNAGKDKQNLESSQAANANAAAISSGPDGAPVVVAAAAAPSTSLDLQAVVYDDFQPVLLRQFQNNLDLTIVGRRSFGELLDQYFFPTEAKKISDHNEKKDTVVVTKKEKFLQDHQRRLAALESQEDANKRKGELIMEQADRIDEAIALITGALAHGTSWPMLRNLLKRAHAEGHPVAYIINDLHFERNAITVLLEKDVDDDEDESDVQPVEVEIDLGLSARANATKFFQLKKQHHKKLEKTIDATDKACASAERKGQRVAQKHGPAKKEILLQRAANWWEKFLWFVTSVGHLCVCATDDQQADLLVRRYLRSGDVFVFTDAPKAHPCIVKGSLQPNEPMALISLQEAGAFCVSRSDVWHSKQSMSPWWVYAQQVTKGNPCGHGVGFSVEGQRNYLKAMELSLAASLLFLAANRPREPIVVDEAIPKEPEQRFSSSDSGDAPTSPSCVPEGGAAASPPTAASPAESRSTPLSGVRKNSSKDKLFGRSRSATSSQNGDSTEETASEQFSRSSVSSFSAATAGEQGAAKSKRLQHKLKKIQKKYGEQDDEDRATAMGLLGNDISKAHKLLLKQEGEAAARKSAAAAIAGSNTASDMDEDEVPDAGRKVHFAESHVDDIVADGTTRKALTQTLFDATGDATREEQRKRSQSFEDDEERLQARIDLEGRTVLAFLTNQPIATDEVQYALLVCTPFSASVHAKYRVQLTPGSEKKGSAVKSVVAHFQAQATTLAAKAMASEAERLAVQRLDENQGLLQLIGNVKVHFPSGRQTPAAVAAMAATASGSAAPQRSGRGGAAPTPHAQAAAAPRYADPAAASAAPPLRVH